MSREYRGEGLGIYYTRLEAKKEKERKKRQEQRGKDSITQVGSLETGNLSDQEAQTDETDTSRANEELGSPDSIDSFLLQDPSKRKLDFPACQ